MGIFHFRRIELGGVAQATKLPEQISLTSKLPDTQLSDIAIEPLAVNHYDAVATCVANAANSSRAALGSAGQPTVIAIA